MSNRIFGLDLFAKLFTLGLLFLFFDVFREFTLSLTDTKFPVLNSLPFFAVGISVCSISLLFLLIKWLSLPFGTQAKRVKLYQGTGNILALAMLLAGCFIKNSPHNFAGKASLILSFGGLLVALLFSWLGKPIADFLSRKKINLDIPIADNAVGNSEPAKKSNDEAFANSIPSKISNNSITQH